MLSTVEHSSCTLFADETEIHSADKDVTSAVVCVNQDLAQVDMWLKENETVAHPEKSNFML